MNPNSPPTPPPPRTPLTPTGCPSDAPPTERASSWAERRRLVADLHADDLLPVPLHLTARILDAVQAAPAPVAASEAAWSAWRMPRWVVRTAAALLVAAAGAFSWARIDPVEEAAHVVSGASRPFRVARLGSATPVVSFGSPPPTPSLAQVAAWPSDWLAVLPERAGGPVAAIAIGLGALGLASGGLHWLATHRSTGRRRRRDLRPPSSEGGSP